MQVRKQFHETLKIQSRQYKILQKQKLAQTPRELHRDIIRKFKEDRIRKMADLASQYDASVSELLRKQKVCLFLCYKIMLTPNHFLIRVFIYIKVEARIRKYSVL